MFQLHKLFQMVSKQKEYSHWCLSSKCWKTWSPTSYCFNKHYPFAISNRQGPRMSLFRVLAQKFLLMMFKVLKEHLSLNKLACTSLKTKWNIYASFLVSVTEDGFPLTNNTGD
jgi:hypothetical protein